MDVFINEEKHSIKEQSTITDIIKYLGIKNSPGMAIAVNESVIPKHDWDKKNINTNDNILLIKTVQGG